jgi:hypothetical protein
MVTDRSVRQLAFLERSGSTARVLNLSKVHRKTTDDADLAKSPLFTNRMLDRSIILKHRLRPDEHRAFAAPRPTATKVLLLIDSQDLRSGAHSFFVGQNNFETIAEEIFGEDLKPGARDRRVLDLLDNLPSLDPFLLREHLRAAQFEPARAYFAISDGDVERMTEFVRDEILALVVLSLGNATGAGASAQRMVDKLLSNSPDGGFEPLRVTLQLNEEQYQSGVFSWRGFLYYKWVFTDLSSSLTAITNEIMTVRPHGPKSFEVDHYLTGARSRLRAKLMVAHSTAKGLLNVYNDAYAGLTTLGQAAGFRSFLLTAPSMFAQLGEQLGAIQHVTSFWKFRMPPGKPKLITAEELADIFLDFELSLSGSASGDDLSLAG